MDDSTPFALWIAIAAMTAVALVFLLPRLVRPKRASALVSRGELNISLYRGQIAELERDQIAGAVGTADAEQARLELERRLLAEATEESPIADRPSVRTAAALAAIVPIAAIAAYLLFGNPAAAVIDPAASLQNEEAANPAELRPRLVAHLASAPEDARGWVTLARIDMEADRFDVAAASYAKALAASPKIARDAGVWCEYADALGMAQGGRLAGKPAELIQRALALDAAHPRALEMAGSLEYERGDFRAASRYWKQLLAHFAPGSPPHREVTAAIARADRLATTSLTPPASGKGASDGS